MSVNQGEAIVPLIHGALIFMGAPHIGEIPYSWSAPFFFKHSFLSAAVVHAV
jgi:hypothetical protein